MKLSISITFLPLLFAPLWGQTIGIAPAWDVRATMTQLVSQVQRYKAVIDQLQVREWVGKGASEAYLRQQQVVNAEVGHLATVSTQLVDQPEKLSLALDAYFRLQTLESITASLSEAASRYQDHPIGDKLSALMNENAATRVKLRQYILDLSLIKEQEYSVAEKEAQRCQATLNRNPLAPPPVTNRPAGKASQEKK